MADVKMYNVHAVERTSPKGGPFIGKCWKCGKEGLTFEAAGEFCDNTAKMSDEASLKRAIDGDDNA